MKVGFRLSQCIKDIAHGQVKYDDVAFIVSFTAIQPTRNMSEVVDNWIHNTVLDEDHRTLYIEIVEKLFKDNKILQPRLQGLQQHWIPEDNCCWMDLYPSGDSDNSLVRSAWDNYRIASALSA